MTTAATAIPVQKEFGPLGILPSMERKLDVDERIDTITNTRAIQILKSIQCESRVQSILKKPVVVLFAGLLAAAATVAAVALIGHVMFASVITSAFVGIALSVSALSSFILGISTSVNILKKSVENISSGRLSRASEDWKYQALQAERYINLLRQKQAQDRFDSACLK